MKLLLQLGCLYFLFSFASVQRTPEVDSLFSILSSDAEESDKRKAAEEIVSIYKEKRWPPDTLLVRTLNQLAFFQWRQSPQLLDSIAQKSLQMAKEMTFSYGEAEALYMTGFAKDLTGQLDGALGDYFKALEMMRKQGRTGKIPIITEYIGIVYRFKGKFDESLRYFLEALRMHEEKGDTLRMGSLYNSLGNLYLDDHQYEKAEESYSLALKYKKGRASEGSLSNTLGNLARIQMQKGAFEEALRSFREVLRIKTALNDLPGMSTAYMSVANALESLGEDALALENISRSIEIGRKLGTREPLAADLRQYAGICSRMGRYKESKTALLEAESIAKDIGAYKELLSIYQEFVRLDTLTGRSEEALKHYMAFAAIDDEINNDEKIREIARLEADYTYQKERDSINFVNTYERTILEEDLESREQNLILFAIGIVLLIILLIIIYSLYRSKKHANIELNRLNQEIIYQRDHLEQLNQTKSRFFSIIAHDIRGPLNTFLGVNMVIQDHLKQNYSIETDALYEKMSKEYAKASDQVLHLLDSLLQWALKEQNAIPYHPENLSLKAAIEETMEMQEAQAKAKRIALHAQMDDCGGVYADRNSVMTILRNLTSNAIKFTQEEGKVEVFCSENGEEVVVSVSDTGVGISKEKLDTIFEINHQHSSRGTAGEKGSGLGLNLVHDFVKMNNGSIEVKSEIGRGTTFHVSLPKSK